MPPLLRADVRPSARTIAVAAAVVALNLLLFVLIAEDIVDGGGLISRDQAVLTWFVDHRTDWTIKAARLVSAIGGFVSLSAMGVILALWLWRHRWKFGMAVAPLVSLALGALASTAAKALFGRDRPPVELHAATVTLAAFPSGHATDAAAFLLATSFTLALTIAARRSIQVLLIATALLLAGLVGVSRLVLGVHWLSDVVAGWSLGTAIAIVVVMVMWFLTADDRSGHTEEPALHPRATE